MANKITLNSKDSITLLSGDNNITLPQGRITLIVLCIIHTEVMLVSDSILREKAKEFAKEIVFTCRDMKKDKKESVLINQILRSTTSIGAHLHEAQYAQGTKDFISKLEIAQKECYETEYWLELLFETDCLSEENYKKLHNDCGAIRRMLISSLKTIKAKNKF